MCCQDNQNNHQDSLASGLIPLGLNVNKSPAIKTITDDFDLKWKNILFNAERRLVEMSKFVSKIEVDVENKIRNLHPNCYTEARLQLNEKFQYYENTLKQHCIEKWDKFKGKGITFQKV